ncbi:MAG: methenyltetrahydromethanopterin cyclohydrolase [Candidatus Bathyarchaeota archaeon]|nr:methenyltetrahydromethanopterin cyclohydrolase [Candidatus Bathyarchaeota archaeon]MDH5596107.1 methenyltetrahydromethanopterin cyclohydrolase [Candidatus Bathyarchaeota archaeon]
MSAPQLSVNHTAWPLVKKLCDDAERYGVAVKETKSGTTLIDAGIKARGGFLAGQIITEICLGGYGHADIFYKQYKDLEIPSIFVYTDHPAVATLGSQFGGWHINMGSFVAIGSGPARALALKPREIYEKINYRDKADVTVLVLETSMDPPESVIAHISNQCGVTSDRLSVILVPTTTISGSTQISGRIVETGIHKLTKLGLDPKLIMHAWGYAPIAPVHPKFAEAMGRTNDAILYAGVASYTIHYDDDEKLRELVDKASSSASKSYGKPFFEIFKEVDYDFRQIDPNLFAPAVLIVNNAATGNTFKAGSVNLEVFKQSIGL